MKQKKIQFELQGFIAEYKRQINQELTPDNLLWAVGEEVSDFEVRKGLVMPVLKMRVEENDAPVYIFASQAAQIIAILIILLIKGLRLLLLLFLTLVQRTKRVMNNILLLVQFNKRNL